MENIGNRMIRAMKLDSRLYEEVESDSSLTGQAALVVGLSSAAAGIGHAGLGGFLGILVGAAVALAGWYIWAFITYFIGTRLLPEPQTHADHGQLLRTLGYASAPGVIRIFGAIPLIGGAATLIAAIWMLAAMVVAVRQALDYTSTLRAVGVCLIGWIVQLVIIALVFLAFGRMGLPA